MNTVFSTGPGFFAALSRKVDRSIAPGTLRVLCARIEAYDIPKGDLDGENTTFTVLFAMAEGRPDVAKALLSLGDAITANAAMLKQVAGQ